jgi:hypothetical protein
MPRTAQSNGIKPYLRALAVIKLGVPVTPTEINEHVGTGDYAAKYISFLRNRNGFEFTIQKDGRKVVSYTLIKEPADAEALRNLMPKAAKSKAPKVAKTSAPKVVVAPAPKAAKTKAPKKVAAKKSVADIKAANLAKLKAVGQRFKADQVQVLTEAPASTSFSIDNDWDSVEGLDLKNLIG